MTSPAETRPAPADPAAERDWSVVALAVTVVLWASAFVGIRAVADVPKPITLKDIKANQLHVYIPGMSFSAYEVVLAELADASDVDTVKSILQARVDAQASGGAWYPEAVEGWLNNSIIVSNGNYVMLAVGADAGVFVDAFNALF